MRVKARYINSSTSCEVYAPCIYSHFMYLLFTGILCTLYLLSFYVPSVYSYFMYPVFTLILCTFCLLVFYVPCIYSHALRVLPLATQIFASVLMYDVFRALINSLVGLHTIIRNKMIINVALLGTWGLPFVVNVRFSKTATDFNE